jgi:hypothetical protein
LYVDIFQYLCYNINKLLSTYTYTIMVKRKTKRYSPPSPTVQLLSALVIVGGIALSASYSSGSSMQNCFYPDATINGAPAGWTIWCESDYVNCHLGDSSGEAVPNDGLSLGAPSSCESGWGDYSDNGSGGGSGDGYGGYDSGGYSNGGEGYMSGCYYTFTSTQGVSTTVFCESPNINCRMNSPSGTALSNSELGALTSDVGNPTSCEGDSGSYGSYEGDYSSSQYNDYDDDNDYENYDDNCLMWKGELWSGDTHVGYEECDNDGYCTMKDLDGNVTATCDYSEGNGDPTFDCDHGLGFDNIYPKEHICTQYKGVDSSDDDVDASSSSSTNPKTATVLNKAKCQKDKSTHDIFFVAIKKSNSETQPKNFCLDKGITRNESLLTKCWEGTERIWLEDGVWESRTKLHFDYEGSSVGQGVEWSDWGEVDRGKCLVNSMDPGDVLTIAEGEIDDDEDTSHESAGCEPGDEKDTESGGFCFCTEESEWRCFGDDEEDSTTSIQQAQDLQENTKEDDDYDYEDDKEGLLDRMKRMISGDREEEIREAINEDLEEYTEDLDVSDKQLEKLADAKQELLDEIATLQSQVTELKSELHDIVARIEDYTFGTQTSLEAERFVRNELPNLSREEAEERLAEIEERAGEELYNEGVIPFEDTPVHEWFTRHAALAKKYGYVEGTGESNGRDLDPSRETNIAEAIMMFGRMAGLDPDATPRSTIGQGLPLWAQSAAGTLEREGMNLDLVFGNSDPNDLITRLQTAQLIQQVADMTSMHASALDDRAFSDIARISDEERAAIAVVYHNNIMSGYDDGTNRFDPYGPLTRAALMKVLVLARENLDHDEDSYKSYRDYRGSDDYNTPPSRRSLRR